MYPIACPAGGGSDPKGRDSAVGWTSKNSNFWLLGGQGFIFPGSYDVPFNDLWEFNASTSTWAKISGCSGASVDWGDCSYAGVYGSLGTPATGNMPGGRFSSVGWTDKSGNLWLFGGQGYDSANNVGVLNDLWELNPVTHEWAWMGGTKALNACGTTTGGQPKYCPAGGTYGVLGVPAAGNTPGSRTGAVGWTDESGNLWLFGGYGYDSAVNEGFLNDLWEFSPLTGWWTWMGGSSTVPQSCAQANRCGEPGVYGILTTAAASNFPGARSGAAGWTDGSGNLWLSEGNGYDSAGVLGVLNDVWEYAPFAPMATITPPSFSPAPGTFTSVQKVTISDAIAGAVINYTTDGTTPTTSSSVYSGAITVSTSQTIEAIATVGGSLSSAITTAAYVINLPPGFTLGASPASVTFASGGQGAVNLTVTPQNGFNSTVNFACSGMAAGGTCSFSPATVKPSGSAVSTQLTVSMTRQSSASRRGDEPFLRGTCLAMAVLLLSFRRARAVRLWLLLFVVGIGLGLLNGCGGGGSATRLPVTSTITVSASSGSLQQTVAVTVTVN